MDNQQKNSKEKGLNLKRKQSTLFCHFPVTSTSTKPNVKKYKGNNSMAQALSQRLDSEVHNLTENGESWYIKVQSWLSPNSDDEFEKEWNMHPDTRHSLKVYGRVCEEKRWSQAWGVSYPYSGSVAVARPMDESHMLPLLMHKINQLMDEDEGNSTAGKESPRSIYNGCLQNWYEPSDTIGLHADDERSMKGEYPIFSLSWGGTRRFLFRAKECPKKSTEIFLENGDLLIMGGRCQETHKHEIPKLRITKDPPTSNRVNWTIRAFHQK